MNQGFSGTMDGPPSTSGPQTLRARWRGGGSPLVGTFVKTTHHQVVEVLSGSGLDFVVLDAEHAPFDRSTLDAALLAARCAALPALVRTASAAPEAILGALDMGAEGVIVPHVADGALAARVAASARYRGGSRGFSNSHRAGGYGRLDPARCMQEADERTLVIAQLEDAGALERLDELMAVQGVDGFLIGRADLMLSLGAASLEAPEVVQAVKRIAAAARAGGRPLGVFLATAEREGIARFARLGARFFIIGSDQSLLGTAAREVARSFHGEGSAHAR